MRRISWDTLEDLWDGPFTASRPTPAQLLEFVDAAVVALDAGEADIARALWQAFAEAVRTGLRLGRGGV